MSDQPQQPDNNKDRQIEKLQQQLVKSELQRAAKGKARREEQVAQFYDKNAIFDDAGNVFFKWQNEGGEAIGNADDFVHHLQNGNSPDNLWLGTNAGTLDEEKPAIPNDRKKITPQQWVEIRSEQRKRLAERNRGKRKRK